jgi:hypothetical protein
MLPYPFTGYPYLVTRIGRTALRNVVLLPSEWPRARLVDLARRQVRANRLEACLCLGPRESVYVHTSGTTSDSEHIPIGVVVVDKLALAEPIPETPELAARRDRLEAFAKAQHPTGYLVGDGLEGGRLATARDAERLEGRDEHGIPIGLTRCGTCGQYCGDCLALKGEGNGDKTPRVIRVHCACENHNRCARCSEALAASRLSAYSFDERRKKVMYAAAYMGLSHRCAS